MLDPYLHFVSVCCYLEVQIYKIPCRSHTISEIVSIWNWLKLGKKDTAEIGKAHYVPVLHESHAKAWLASSGRLLAVSVSLGAGAGHGAATASSEGLHWELLVCSRGWFSGTATFFNAFVFQKWHRSLLKQTGVGETGHALSFAACANMGLASLMRDLQWPRRGSTSHSRTFWTEQQKFQLGPVEDRT